MTRKKYLFDGSKPIWPDNTANSAVEYVQTSTTLLVSIYRHFCKTNTEKEFIIYVISQDIMLVRCRDYSDYFRNHHRGRRSFLTTNFRSRFVKLIAVVNFESAH